MELLRSLLFVPGNRRNMLERAATVPADILLPDMEDSVPIAEKPAARDLIAEMLPVLSQGGRRVVVRVNGQDTGLLEEDLRAAVTPHTYGINAVKVHRPWDVQEVDRLITQLEAKEGLEKGRIRLLLWIESAMAVVNAYDVISASPRVVAVSFGAEDFTADMGIQRTEENSEVFLPRAMVAIAARAANVVPLDVVYANFRDEEGLRRDIQMARSMGYKGKFAIHPSQVEPINSLFRPLPEEVDYARRVVEAFAEAEARGSGATSLDGKMIDVPVYKRAQDLLDVADAITGAEAPQGAGDE